MVLRGKLICRIVSYNLANGGTVVVTNRMVLFDLSNVPHVEGQLTSYHGSWAQRYNALHALVHCNQ